jgi:hypothetical protein
VLCQPTDTLRLAVAIRCELKGEVILLPCTDQVASVLPTGTETLNRTNINTKC